MNTNLRPSDNSCCKPVGTPATLADNAVINDGSLLPGALSVNPSGSFSVLSTYGTNLRATNIGADTSDVSYQRLNTSGATAPTCCASTGEAVVVAGPATPPATHSFDESKGRFKSRDFRVTRPPFALVAEVKEEFTATAGDIRLSRAYTTHDTALTEADSLAVSSSLARLYTDIADRAAASRLHIQPVLASYRLKNSRGRVVYTSAPVLLTPPGCLQCLASSTGRVSASSPSVVTGMSLTAKGYAVRLIQTFPFEAGLAANIATVEIIMSSQLHPFVKNARAATRLQGNGSAGYSQLTAWLPGAPRQLHIGAPGGWLHNRISLLLTDRGATAMYAAGSGTLDNFAKIDAFHSDTPDLDSQLNEMKGTCDGLGNFLQEIYNYSAIACQHQQSLAMKAPHIFGAEAAAVSGDTFLWGGLQRILFGGYYPSEMAASFSPAASGTECTADVQIGASTILHRAETIPSKTPLTFSPLLVYPDGDAKTITLAVGNRTQSFPLSLADDGCTAFYLSDDGLPIEVPAFAGGTDDEASSSQTAGAVDADEVTEAVPLVGLADISDPTDLKAVMPVSTGPVVAVAAAPRGSGGLDFGRNMFFVFGPSGTDLVRADASRKKLTAITLDRRAVMSAARVAVGAAKVSVLAGGDLVTFSASHRPVTLRQGIATSDRLGYDPVHDEYWCCRDPSPGLSLMSAAEIDDPGLPPGQSSDISELPEATPDITIVSGDGSTAYYRDDIAVKSLLTAPDRLLAADTSGRLVDLSHESPGPASFSYSRRIPLKRHCGPSILRLDTGLTGRSLSGHITVYADSSDNGLRYITLADTDFSGDVNHPLRLTLAAPHAHSLLLQLTARTARSDTVNISSP